MSNTMGSRIADGETQHMLSGVVVFASLGVSPIDSLLTVVYLRYYYCYYCC